MSDETFEQLTKAVLRRAYNHTITDGSGRNYSYKDAFWVLYSFIKEDMQQYVRELKKERDAALEGKKAAEREFAAVRETMETLQAAVGQNSGAVEKTKEHPFRKEPVVASVDKVVSARPEQFGGSLGAMSGFAGASEGEMVAAVTGIARELLQGVTRAQLARMVKTNNVPPDFDRQLLGKMSVLSEHRRFSLDERLRMRKLFSQAVVNIAKEAGVI